MCPVTNESAFIRMCGRSLYNSCAADNLRAPTQRVCKKTEDKPAQSKWSSAGGAGKIASFGTNGESRLLRSDDEFTKRVVFDGIIRVISQVVGRTLLLRNLSEVSMRVCVFGVDVCPAGLPSDAIH